MRVAVVASALCLSIVSLSNAGDAEAAIRRATDIPAQSLGTALQSLAREHHLQVVFRSEVVGNLQTNGAAGEFTFAEALTQLLSGTGLTFQYVDEKTITIMSATQSSRSPSSSKEQSPLPTAARDVAASDAVTPSDAQRRSFWDRFRLAQNDAGGAAQSSSGGTEGAGAQSGSETGAVKLEEILVTAQKRSERLQDVPVPVTAITADSLVTTNQLQLQDYYTRIPGLSLTPPGSYGGSTIAIRGLVSGLYANPTVGIVVDDVPYGSPSSSGFGNVVAEIDPSDLAQVEVLRGPQGTLYGASSIGGLLKYVTVDPSTAGFAGHVQAGLTDVQNGDGSGYSLRGSVNLPLSDTWAARVSGFTRHDPGYIDDPDHSLKGVNKQRGEGGRFAALWSPSDAFSLRLSALIQNSESDGNTYVSTAPGAGDLEQSVVPNSGGYEKKLQIYTANLRAQLGAFELTSISAYTDIDNTYLFDFTPGLGGAAASFGVSGVSVVQPNRTKRFTEELRLATTLGARTDWLFGLFYGTEDTDGNQGVWAADFNNGAKAGELLHFHTIASFDEYAAFTNFTFHFTDRFDLQVGGRANRNEPTYAQTAGGSLIGGTTGGAKFESRDSSFTYLVTPSFKVSPDLMVYARFASGYRPGGPNSSIGFGIPPEYGPDKTQNYELGVKGNAFNRAVSFDASAYYIDWKAIQLAQYTVAGYIDNGSRARSTGVELSLESEPVDGLTLSGWVSYNDAKLTEDLPAANAFGLSGDRLPYSARFSGNISARQSFPLSGTVSGVLGVELSYVGERWESFPSSSAGVRRALPAYAKTDLLAGLRYDTWSANLFVNNVADRRGVVGADAAAPQSVTYIQPRTIGLSVAKSF